MPELTSPIDGDKSFVIATTNQGKRREFERLLGPLLKPEWRIYDRRSFPQDLGEVEEDRPSFEGNAIKKAVETAQATGCSVLADDSGLMVDALGGAPGVKSSRFAGEEADDEANNRRLLEGMKHVAKGERSARFVSVLCLALWPNRVGRSFLAAKGLAFEEIEVGSPDREAELVCEDGLVLVWFRGTLAGRIAAQARGEDGFGYDPLFEVVEEGRTLAEMSVEEKNRISHRAAATRRLLAFFS